MDFGTFQSWRYVVFVFQAFTLPGVDLLQLLHVSSKHWPGPFNSTSAISDTPCAGLSVGSPVFANTLSHPLNFRVLIYSPWNDVNWTPWVSVAGTCADCNTRFGWTTLNSDELVSLLKYGERSSSVNVRLDTKIRIREEEERSNLEDQGLQLMWNTRKTFLLYSCSALVLVICGVGVEQVADRGYCWHLDVLQECWALKWYQIMKSWVCIPFATLSFTDSVTVVCFFWYLCGVGQIQQLVGDLSSCCYIFRCQLIRPIRQYLCAGCQLLQISWVGKLWGKICSYLFSAFIIRNRQWNVPNPLELVGTAAW